jgi:DNA polymerase (family 10)
MRNAEIADAFSELADLYELDGAVVHRVLAYRTAAATVRDARVSVAELSRAGRAEELPGIGRTLAQKIDSLLEEGVIPATQRLRERYPPGLIEVTRLPGFGAKRARKVHDALGVASLEDLRRAAETHALRAVPGFGPKAEENVLASLAAHEDGAGRPRVLLSRAREVGDELVRALREDPSVDRVELAGSARRMADTVKDLDVVASSSDPAALVAAFEALDLVEDVSRGGEAGARGVTHSGLEVDLRIVAPRNFGNLLQHFTGSGRHNEALRTEAVRRGWHVSEYGVTDPDGVCHACATEEAAYELLGMAWIPPELREDRGELRAAREGRLPDLIALADLRGDLHCHTIASDGRATIEEMVEGARALGHQYLAITDHSATSGFGNAVSVDELRRQVERIRELDAATPDLRVLAGSEVNVLPDGSLDYADAVLEELDWVVASLHSSFRMGEEEMTRRMVRAMEHPLVDAIGHPTGRLLSRREPYALDMGRVVEAAARTGTFLEINGNPDRRDLNDVHARMAAEAGVVIVIDSDAHWVRTLANLRYGVATARRAWLNSAQVANTRAWPELDALRKRGAGAPA